MFCNVQITYNIILFLHLDNCLFMFSSKKIDTTVNVFLGRMEGRLAQKIGLLK
jgi:hypothetical protein